MIVICSAIAWLAIITVPIYGISLYGAHLAKLRDQRAADGVNWSICGMRGWIKCSEQMPDASGPYLVFKENSAYQYGIYDWSRSGGVWIPELMRKKRSESKPKTWVTHWQPLPEPPK